MLLEEDEISLDEKQNEQKKFVVEESSIDQEGKLEIKFNFELETEVDS